MQKQYKDRLQWFVLLGCVGTLFYFAHVLVGRALYPGYNPLSQAISDLTALTSPSKEKAAAFSTVYSFFTISSCTLMCIFYKNKVNAVFRTGVYLYTIMQWISAIGYTLFPLSQSGYAGNVTDILHMVVTVAVVLLTVLSMGLIATGCMRDQDHRKFGILTIIFLSIMTVGSIGTGFVPPAYFGVAQRLNVYAVVIYTSALSILTFRFAPTSSRVS